MNVRIEVLSPTLCGTNLSGMLGRRGGPQRMGHPRCGEGQERVRGLATRPLATIYDVLVETGVIE